MDKESSNFTNHAIYVPTLYNIALLSQKQHPLFHVIGSNSSLELNRIENESVYHIKNEQIDSKIINSNAIYFYKNFEICYYPNLSPCVKDNIDFIKNIKTIKGYKFYLTK